MEFRILGPLEVLDGGRDVTPSRPKQRALLALMLIRAGELVTVDEAIDALWGEPPPPAARNAVQGHVSALRKLVGADRIDTREGYRLRVDDGEFDVDRFERLVTDARGRSPAERRAILEEALALFRGEPLAEFRYDAFAQPEATRLEELRLNALEERIDADLALRRHAQVVPELEQLVQQHPLREAFHAQLMLALYRAGRQADALDAFQRARRALDELGLAPGGALRQLQRRILDHDPTLELPPELTARLPQPPTPLLGRDDELARASMLLLRGDVRVVTLVGPGGAGKTRLALELARRNGGRFADGVAFVPLATLADASLVLPTIAHTLEVPESPTRSPDETLADHLSSRETLLVLDNLEHLLACVPALGSLVAAATRLKLLITSREPLRMYGEHLYPIPPLDDRTAIGLFLDRAQAVRHDLDREATHETAAEICRRLDGLPLAIELAAAQVSAFEPATLLAQLSDRLALLVAGPRDQPERQQTLRNTLEWSHELLSPDERALFARLSVFAGGWTLHAADSVCGGDVDVVAGAAALHDKSLLQLAASEPEPRLAMLETIREYATERLDAAGETEAIKARHADHFLFVAEAAEPQLPSSPADLLDALELEHDDIRAAVEWFEATGDHERTLRLTGAIWRFWYLRGYVGEGRRRLESALAADDRPTLARAKSLNGAAAMAINAGDRAGARARAEEGLALHRELGDEVGGAYAAFMLANTLDKDEAELARALYEESIEVFRAAGAHAWMLLAARHLAYLYDEHGPASRARALHAENLRLARELGNDRFAASSLSALAAHALREDRVDNALTLLAESLSLHRKLGDVLDTAVDAAAYAEALARLGDLERAACIASALDSLSADIGVRRNSVAAHAKQTFELARDALDPSTFADACERGRKLTINEAVDLALQAS